MNRLLLSLALLLPLPLAAQEIGALTLVEGHPRLIRGTTILQGAEGVRLRKGDIIESSDPGFVQLEFAEGTVVALGASSRLFIFNYVSGRTSGEPENKANVADLVLLTGWLKGEVNSRIVSYRFESPLLAAATRGGTVVLHATVEAAEIFIESGTAMIDEVRPDGSPGHSVQDAKSGQFFFRQTGKSMTTDFRLSPAFTDSMPRPFRDTLPPLLPHFEGKSVEPKRDHEVSYAEVEPWLTIGPAWRRGLVERFRPRVNDATFRKALEDHMKDHPEWDPILHPERYAPKVPAQGPDSSQAGSSR
jgi:hypothetical protein